MEIPDFHYHQAASVGEACELLGRLAPDADVLAGGTEVLVDLKRHAWATRHLVSLKGIAELRAITSDDEGLHLGALATQAEVAASDVVAATYPALAEAAATMAAVQVRNRGTIGGNFCSAVPSADLPPICIAGGAEIRLAGRLGDRAVPAGEFFLGPRETVREHDEVLTEIFVPAASWSAGCGAAYRKYALRGASALAVTGVAAWVRLEGEVVAECRITLGAVAPTPMLAADASAAMVGQAPDAGAFERAAEIAAKECSPISDLRASADYRRELLRAMVPRVLADACARGGESS